jgi:hypothetical protein
VIIISHLPSHSPTHIDSQEVKVNFVGGMHHIGYFECRTDAINANNLALTYLETFIDDDLSPKRIEKHVDMIREAIRLPGGVHLSQETREYVSEVANMTFSAFFCVISTSLYLFFQNVKLWYAGMTRYIGAFDNIHNAVVASALARNCRDSLKDDNLLPEQIKKNVYLMRAATDPLVNNDCDANSTPHLFRSGILSVLNTGGFKSFVTIDTYMRQNTLPTIMACLNSNSIKWLRMALLRTMLLPTGLPKSILTLTIIPTQFLPWLLFAA